MTKRDRTLLKRLVTETEAQAEVDLAEAKRTIARAKETLRSAEYVRAHILKLK